MTPVMRQQAVRHAVVSSGLRCVADQCGAIDRDNEILAPDGDDCATGCDGQGIHRRLRCRVNHEHGTDLTAGGAAAYGERALVGAQFPGILELRASGGASFLEKVDAVELSGSMVTQPSLAESS